MNPAAVFVFSFGCGRGSFERLAGDVVGLEDLGALGHQVVQRLVVAVRVPQSHDFPPATRYFLFRQGKDSQT